jgi:MFS transporter, DHA2 family, multidrug resistance protein
MATLAASPATASVAPVPADGLPLPARYYAMATIVLGIALSVLDSTIVNLALPGIARDLHAGAAQSIWVVNAYQLAILTMLLPLASIGDLVGYRRVYFGGVVLFTIASAACAMATSLPALAASRAVQGLGAAGIMAVNAALVRLTYPSKHLGRGIALNSMVVATSSVAGPTLAAAVLSVASWPWLFAINIPFGIVVLALGWRALPHNAARAPTGSRLSWLDVLLNIAMFSLVFLGADGLGVGLGRTAPATGRMTSFALLAAGVGVAAFYVRRQLKRAVPLFPVDLLRIRIFALSMCTSVTAFCAQTLAYVGLPFLLLEAYGRTTLEAGALLTAWPLGVVVSAPVAGRLIGRHPGGLLGGIGLAMMAIGLALVALLPAHPASADIAWRLALCGAGFGLFQSPNNHIIVTSAPLNRSGAASGMLGTARLTGQTIGALLLAVIFSAAGAHDARGPVIALFLAAAFAAVASGFSMSRLGSAASALPCGRGQG